MIELGFQLDVELLVLGRNALAKPRGLVGQTLPVSGHLLGNVLGDRLPARRLLATLLSRFVRKLYDRC